ncbi:hypothetical protein EVAR_3331_1, partial [Eumeta japonica]
DFQRAACTRARDAAGVQLGVLQMESRYTSRSEAQIRSHEPRPRAAGPVCRWHTCFVRLGL